MSGFKWLMQQYFQLPKWERIGTLVLVSIILIGGTVLFFWPSSSVTDEEKNALNEAERKVQVQLNAYKKNSDNQKNKFNYSSNKKYNSDFSSENGFIHDLSKATPNQLIKAGLSKKVAFNLYNYLKKGGQIKSWNDVSRIYGMTNEMMLCLSKHVALDSVEENNILVNTLTAIKATASDKVKVDLNLADSAQLAAVYGISPKMAAVIIRYRAKVFAFHSVEQLNEMFKEPLKNYETIKEGVEVKNFKPCIAINSITVDELKKHQYFKKDNLAGVLIAYRDKHGKFKNSGDLKKCVLVTDEVLAKILPYLSFE